MSPLKLCTKDSPSSFKISSGVFFHSSRRPTNIQCTSCKEAFKTSKDLKAAPATSVFREMEGMKSEAEENSSLASEVSNSTNMPRLVAQYLAGRGRWISVTRLAWSTWS